jgi:hypothetical protein
MKDFFQFQKRFVRPGNGVEIRRHEILPSGVDFRGGHAGRTSPAGPAPCRRSGRRQARGSGSGTVAFWRAVAPAPSDHPAGTCWYQR